LNKKKLEDSEVVASKKGKVYHFPWCSGAIRLKEKNKRYFKDSLTAESAGLRKAKNCEGL
jgi:methylphosphotriester-DNA--protein-cysteine methyltransferase